jgi:hypothetical protein
LFRPEFTAPPGPVIAQLALVTGATKTVINSSVLRLAGYDPAVPPERVRVTTGSGVEYAPRLTPESIEALEQQRADFSALSHTLPPSASVDGLLGLDFFRGHRLMIDLITGEIELD